jgi:hypothetical protein
VAAKISPPLEVGENVRHIGNASVSTDMATHLAGILWIQYNTTIDAIGSKYATVADIEEGNGIIISSGYSERPDSISGSLAVC